ncbi:unnamed protein product, partial [Ixodes persulcatus]
ETTHPIGGVCQKARSHHVADCEASSVVVVIIFAIAVGRSGWGSDLFSRICGRLRLHGNGHDWFLFHWSRANDKNNDFIRPQRVDDPADHPDAIRCFAARLAGTLCTASKWRF